MRLQSILSGAAALLLVSCSSDPALRTTTDRSVGQQLTDLEQARQQGTITDREYVRLKRVIIRNND